jgi:coenzyme A diphosphatase NUDT7
MHRFRTTQTPIKGLTSDVLVSHSYRPQGLAFIHMVRQIYTAEVAFGRQTSYPRMAPGQLAFDDAIVLALKDLDNSMVAAMRKEDRERFINA